MKAAAPGDDQPHRVAVSVRQALAREVRREQRLPRRGERDTPAIARHGADRHPRGVIGGAGRVEQVASRSRRVRPESAPPPVTVSLPPSLPSAVPRPAPTLTYTTSPEGVTVSSASVPSPTAYASGCSSAARVVTSETPTVNSRPSAIPTTLAPQPPK